MQGLGQQELAKASLARARSPSGQSDLGPSQAIARPGMNQGWITPGQVSARHSRASCCYYRSLRTRFAGCSSAALEELIPGHYRVISSDVFQGRVQGSKESEPHLISTRQWATRAPLSPAPRRMSGTSWHGSGDPYTACRWTPGFVRCNGGSPSRRTSGPPGPSGCRW